MNLLQGSGCVCRDARQEFRAFRAAEGDLIIGIEFVLDCYATLMADDRNSKGYCARNCAGLLSHRLLRGFISVCKGSYFGVKTTGFRVD